jgi:hypothetical protein
VSGDRHHRGTEGAQRRPLRAVGSPRSSSRTTPSRSSTLNGFATNASAPSSMAFCRSRAPRAETTTTRGRSSAAASRAPEGRPSVHHRHHDVEEHDPRPVAPDLVQRVAAVAGGERPVALGLQAEQEHPDDLRLVVHDEHAGRDRRFHLR